jgi:peptide/nickel transport system substrate-binding protein
VPELTAETNAALLERDNAKRAAIYAKLQKEVLETSPFVIIFQQNEVAGLRSAVQDYKLGPTFDTNFVANVSKN